MRDGLPPYPNETLDQYMDRIAGVPIPTYTQDGRDFVARSDHVTEQMLRRLDALDRSDAFWDNTNGKATLFKLWEFARKLLAENPCDEDALLYLVTLEANSRGDLRVPEWKALHDCGKLDVKYLILTAYTAALFLGDQASCGVRISRDLARMLQFFGLVDIARPFLESLAASPPLGAPDGIPESQPGNLWVKEVIRRLDDRDMRC